MIKERIRDIVKKNPCRLIHRLGVRRLCECTRLYPLRNNHWEKCEAPAKPYTNPSTKHKNVTSTIGLRTISEWQWHRKGSQWSICPWGRKEGKNSVCWKNSGKLSKDYSNQENTKFRARWLKQCRRTLGHFNLLLPYPSLLLWLYWR